MSRFPDDRPERHHSDLNIFAVIVAICEGGTIYTQRGKETARKIIRICQAEQQMQLRAFDRAKAEASHDRG